MPLLHNMILYFIGGHRTLEVKEDHVKDCHAFHVKTTDSKNSSNILGLNLVEDYEFPKLISERSMHSCFILKDYLFVAFGT